MRYGNHTWPCRRVVFDDRHDLRVIGMDGDAVAIHKAARCQIKREIRSAGTD